MNVCDHKQFCTMQQLSSYLIYEVSGSLLFHFTWISWRMKCLALEQVVVCAYLVVAS